MNRLRNRLIAVVLAATLAPLAVTLWITDALFEESLRYANTRELDELSKTLETTGREYYQRVRESLKADAGAGRIAPQRYPAAERTSWPEPLLDFWQSGEAERFQLAGAAGDRLDLLVRRNDGIAVYSRKLGGVGMSRLSEQYSRARALVQTAAARDLRRGFTYTFLLLAAAVWLAALAVLVYFANRISRPIQQLTAGLAELAAGNLSVRVEGGGDDEVGRAVKAFNHMAVELRQNRERLVLLTRLESWQALARKMAHEVKNSLTPIRLTMEEISARRRDSDPAFLEQATQIVVDEVNGLERRVRAFSELASEPPVSPAAVDLAALIEERIAFLRNAHPEVTYNTRHANGSLTAWADADLVRGLLTNLIENAAEAAGPGGVVLAATAESGGRAVVEVHDSGPGLSPHARQTLFEPAISFKKDGMGVGLSIARKSALLCGGDILLIEGELGGAAFRVQLPRAARACA